MVLYKEKLYRRAWMNGVKRSTASAVHVVRFDFAKSCDGVFHKKIAAEKTWDTTNANEVDC